MPADFILIELPSLYLKFKVQDQAVIEEKTFPSADANCLIISVLEIVLVLDGRVWLFTAATQFGLSMATFTGRGILGYLR